MGYGFAPAGAPCVGGSIFKRLFFVLSAVVLVSGCQIDRSTRRLLKCTAQDVEYGMLIGLYKENIASVEPGFCAEGCEGVEWLDLGGNDISVLKAGTFMGLPKLKQLYLNENNDLELIEAGAFEGLTRLKGLWLNGNGVKQVEPGAFDGLDSSSGGLDLYLKHKDFEKQNAEALKGITGLKIHHGKNLPKRQFFVSGHNGGKGIPQHW